MVADVTDAEEAHLLALVVAGGDGVFAVSELHEFVVRFCGDKASIRKAAVDGEAQVAACGELRCVVTGGGVKCAVELLLFAIADIDETIDCAPPPPLPFNCGEIVAIFCGDKRDKCDDRCDKCPPP